MASINEVNIYISLFHQKHVSDNNLRRARYWDWWPCLGSIPDAGQLFWYVTNQPPKANSAYHPSGVGKWRPALAGDAKAGMVYTSQNCNYCGSAICSWRRPRLTTCVQLKRLFVTFAESGLIFDGLWRVLLRNFSSDSGKKLLHYIPTGFWSNFCLQNTAYFSQIRCQIRCQICCGLYTVYCKSIQFMCFSTGTESVTIAQETSYSRKFSGTFLWLTLYVFYVIELRRKCTR